MNEEYIKEIEAFVRSEQTFTLTNGKTIKVKPLSWGQELKIIKILGELFNKVSKNSSMVIESLGEIELGSSLGAILEESPEAITEICSIITKLSTEEIENTFTFEDVIEVCFPFLLSLLKRLEMKITEKAKKLFPSKQE